MVTAANQLLATLLFNWQNAQASDGLTSVVLDQDKLTFSGTLAHNYLHCLCCSRFHGIRFKRIYKLEYQDLICWGCLIYPPSVKPGVKWTKLWPRWVLLSTDFFRSPLPPTPSLTCYLQGYLKTTFHISSSQVNKQPHQCYQASGQRARSIERHYSEKRSLDLSGANRLGNLL